MIANANAYDTANYGLACRQCINMRAKFVSAFTFSNIRPRRPMFVGPCRISVRQSGHYAATFSTSAVDFARGHAVRKYTFAF